VISSGRSMPRKFVPQAETDTVAALAVSSSTPEEL
jgi:hypothetical protein